MFSRFRTCGRSTPRGVSLGFTLKRNSSTVLQKSSNKDLLETLIQERVPYKSLPQEFYTNEEIFKQDLERIWKRNWLFAGFNFQIPKPGDYFTWEVANESLLIVRGEDQQLRALYNVCRHRGARLCQQAAGSAKRFVCPYHGWTYGPDGKLLKANYMAEDFKPAEHSLHPIHLRTVGGLIYISFDKNPIDFEEGAKVIGQEIIPHGFEDAKAAHILDYDIHANWKLVYENNRECYHCNVAHPEYIRANYDTSFSYRGFSREVDPNTPNKEEVVSHIQERNERWAKLGLKASPASDFPGAGWYRASRTPLRKGWVSESLDGKSVSSKLMGVFTEPDVGSCRVHTLPNFWIHASGDHAVATRLHPVSPQLTKAKVFWLVHKDAQEGRDYKLDKLLPFWQKTSEQDWDLCKWNQQGVNSSAYSPGPLSPLKEPGLEKFIIWYLKNVQKK